MEKTRIDLTAGTAREADTVALASDFDALYEKHAAFVWRTLRSLGVPSEDTEDAAQEVFSTVFRKLSAFEGRSSLRTWLCGIAVGVARNHTRKRKRRTGLDAALPQPEATSPAESTEALDLVTRCLEDLDENLRMVFVLAELEQLTAPEIAEVLTVNVNTVYSRLRLARERFEQSLERHGGTRS
jgi:RNA polymerase sigma-70 factor, ECF subfamily